MRHRAALERQSGNARDAERQQRPAELRGQARQIPQPAGKRGARGDRVVDANHRLHIALAEHQRDGDQRHEAGEAQRRDDPCVLVAQQPEPAALQQQNDNDRHHEHGAELGVERQHQTRPGTVEIFRQQRFAVAQREVEAPDQECEGRDLQHHLAAPQCDLRHETHRHGHREGMPCRQEKARQREAAGGEAEVEEDDDQLRHHMRHTEQRVKRCRHRVEQRRIEQDRECWIFEIVVGGEAARIVRHRRHQILDEGAVERVARRVAPPEIAAHRRGREQRGAGQRQHRQRHHPVAAGRRRCSHGVWARSDRGAGRRAGSARSPRPGAHWRPRSGRACRSSRAHWHRGACAIADRRSGA